MPEKKQSEYTHNLYVLRKLFPNSTEDVLIKILETGTQKMLAPAEYLFMEGEEADSFYIVLRGRLRAVRDSRDGATILGDIAEGEPVGEFALFAKESRMASILALRSSIVLEITHKDYKEIVVSSPDFAETLTSFIIRRMKRNIQEVSAGSAPKNIALVKLQQDLDLNPWTDALIEAFKDHDVDVCVHHDYEVPEDEEYNFFTSLDEKIGINILVCSDSSIQWSQQCLLYADLVVVATDFYGDKELYQIENHLELYTQNIFNKKIYFVMLHEDERSLPVNTHEWLNERKVNLHLHIRKNHEPDTRRICRIILNQAIGLVLGGGGAKGYAHVGAVKALQEAGIEIDFLGGTSAGAFHGLGMSYCDFDFSKIEEICEISATKNLMSKDYAFPLISLKSGKRLSAFLKYIFSDSAIEDIWVNSYCVSTNYSSSKTIVHERGLTSKMLRASIAVPGVFPPVVINGQLHVDGAVLDNLPIEPMYSFPVRHIIAISLSGLEEKKVQLTDIPSSRHLLWDKLSKKRQFRLPGIMSLIINSLTISSRQKQEITKEKVSLYYEMNLKEVGFLDDSQWRQTVQKGYEQMQAFLSNIEETEKFWTK